MTLAEKLNRLLRRLSWRGWKIRPIVKIEDEKKSQYYLPRKGKR